MNPLLLKALPYAGWLGALALAGMLRCSDVQRQRAIGAANQRIGYLSDSLKVARAEGRKVDSIFRRDTVRLTRRIETTVTLIDTLLHSDTVTLTQRESVLVFVADSLVQQCRATVQSCADLAGSLRARLSLTEQQRDAYRVLIPSAFQRTRTTLRDAAIGYGIRWLQTELTKRN